MAYSVVDSHHIAMGQVGSAYLDATEDAASLTGNLVVIAITMTEDTTFDTTTGLVATDAAYMGTGTSTHGNSITSGDAFPAGLTIYGRWSNVGVATGACIVYLGT
jgi:hypothetical protein